MKTNEYSIHVRGLLHCCVESLKADDSEAAPGDTRTCRKCGYNSRMFLDGGAWVRHTP